MSTEHTHTVEVHHVREEADDGRDVSVEITKGQSGKFGWSIKAYGNSANAAVRKLQEARWELVKTIESLERLEGKS
jgi:hypothetical protein